MHHTDCGRQKVEPQAFKDELQRETGVKPEWSVESFDDPYVDVAQSMRRLTVSPFIADKHLIRGFVYDPN